MIWENILDNNDCTLREIHGYGEPRLVFQRASFRLLFYRIWTESARWKWGLIETGFFDTRRIVRINADCIRFAIRIDSVQYSCFETYGLELLYHELGELPSSSSETEEV